MAKAAAQTVLFVDTGTLYRGRLAAEVFRTVTARMGLPWRGSCHVLSEERTAKPARAVAAAADTALQSLGVRASSLPSPTALTSADLEGTALVVVPGGEEDVSLLRERFPALTDRVVWWGVEDTPEALPRVQQQVMQLVAVLCGGGEAAPVPAEGEQVCPRCRQPVSACTCPPKKEPARPPAVVRVGRETKGRRGKGVTLVWDVPLDEDGLRELAARLKERCGTGGTIKDGRIEIQGDQRDRLTAELEKLGYRVKRVGG